jgi:hypothetical protein
VENHYFIVVVTSDTIINYVGSECYNVYFTKFTYVKVLKNHSTAL